MADDAITKLSYSHKAMVDLMVAHPQISARELALRFGVTEPWISRVRSSSMFREHLKLRTLEIVDPMLVAEVEERFDAMVNRSLEVLMDKLSKPSEDIPDELALQAATLGAKARGYGGFGAKVAAPIAAPDPNRLDTIANRLRTLNQNQQGVYDVEAREVPSERRPEGKPADPGATNPAAL